MGLNSADGDGDDDGVEAVAVTGWEDLEGECSECSFCFVSKVIEPVYLE